MAGNETIRSKIAGLIRSHLIDKTSETWNTWNVSYSSCDFKKFPECGQNDIIAVAEASIDDTFIFTVKEFYGSMKGADKDTAYEISGVRALL